jgi:hypothetical protein
MKPLRRPCIFCGTPEGLSKEHFWPEWMALHLPVPPSTSNIGEFYESEGKQPHRLERRSERPGAVHTKKIRAVCGRCNNGWMSVLETRAKPILLQFITREGTVLLPDQCEVLSLWASVKAIVGEYSTDDTAMTLMDDRHAVRQDRVPSYFRIFLALHELKTHSGYARHSTTLSLSREGPVPSLPRTISRNIQAISFIVGPLLFYVACARVSGFNLSALDPRGLMHRLSPMPDAAIDLQETKALTQGQVASISNLLPSFWSSPITHYGGPLRRDDAT